MEIFGLSKEEIVKIRAVFSKYNQVEKVLIYGSRAMGNFKPASDIDLTLIGENLNLSPQQQLEVDLDDLLLPYKFDVSNLSKINNPELLDHIQRVGKDFYEKLHQKLPE